MCAACLSSHQLCRALIYVLITKNITVSAQIMTRVGASASVKLFSTQDIIKVKYVLHVCRNHQHQLSRALITNNIVVSAQMMTRVGAWASVKLFTRQDHHKVQICFTCLS